MDLLNYFYDVFVFCPIFGENFLFILKMLWRKIPGLLFWMDFFFCILVLSYLTLFYYLISLAIYFRKEVGMGIKLVQVCKTISNLFFLLYFYQNLLFIKITGGLIRRCTATKTVVLKKYSLKYGTRFNTINNDIIDGTTNCIDEGFDSDSDDHDDELLMRQGHKDYNLLSLLKPHLDKFSAILIYLFEKKKNIDKRTFGEGYLYLRGLFFICFIDACLTDDEPLWEPVEWSLVQTWIFFIFIFSWIAENLITSRYGSYTGRDKRVWFAWYRTFWGIEAFFVLSMGATALFIIVPFYYELTYTISFVICWWNWYSRVFFLKLLSIMVIVLLISILLLIGTRWLNWKKIFFLVATINIFILFLLYTQFIVSFFGYFCDPVWYQKTRCIDYIQLSHEPLKWGFGPAKRDHFAYHNISTVFWYKNDRPFAAAMFFFSLTIFLSLFLIYIYWLILLRRIYSTKELSYTYLTYCVSCFRQFFYFLMLFFVFIFLSWIMAYWRFPIEYIWLINPSPWISVFYWFFYDYFSFLSSLI